MQDNDKMTVIKIIIMLALIFVVIAQIFPWMGFDFGKLKSMAGGSIPADINYVMDFYPWGYHLLLDFGSYFSNYGFGETPSKIDIWILLYVVTLGAPEVDASGTDTSTLPTVDVTASTIATVSLILTFICCILAIILGLLAFRNIEKRKTSLCLSAGILSLIAIIFFVVGTQVILNEATKFAISSGSNPSQIQIVFNLISYSFGFIMMIIAMILFFIGYFSHYALIRAPESTISQRAYPLPGYEPPQVGRDSKSSPSTGFKPKPVQSFDTATKNLCPQCGAVIDGKPRFCINCGKELY